MSPAHSYHLDLHETARQRRRLGSALRRGFNGILPLLLAPLLSLAMACGASACGATMVIGDKHPADADSPAALPDLDAAEACGPHSASAAAACVDEQRLRRDVLRIAQPRPAGSRHHQAVQQHCVETLRALRYRVTLRSGDGFVNVVGHKPGFSNPAELVVVGAHYDQRPDCEGADDNASGVAAALETARVLAHGRFARSLEVACWDGSQTGWRGAAAHAEGPAEDTRMRLAVVYDSVAFASDAIDSQTLPPDFEKLWPDQALALLDDEYRANFLAIFTDGGAQQWAQLALEQARQAKLTTHLMLVSEAMKRHQPPNQRADHASFWDADVPAMLITDTGHYRNHHSGCKSGAQDAPSSLDYRFLRIATQAGIAAVINALEVH